MKQLPLLIQIASRTADERRLEVVRLEGAVAEARGAVADHDAVAEAEAAVAARDHLSLAAYSLWVRQSRRRRDQLIDRVAQLERAAGAARDALRDAFADLKRLQLAEAATLAEECKRAARRAEARAEEQETLRPRELAM